MRKRITAHIALLLAVLTLLTACGETGEPAAPEDAAGPLTVAVRLREGQGELDPAFAEAEGSATVLYHLYENLLRWEDGGGGHGQAAPGQAASWTVETDYAGNATYTFTLRENIRWSDGAEVTAEDFVTAWRRLADPATGSPHSGLLSMVAGYGEVRETGDATLLGVSAPDKRTFVVSLEGSCAYFLSEVCGGACTMPVRDGAYNGPYVLAGQTEDELILARSETYYDHVLVGPEELRFVAVPDDDDAYQRFLEGGLDLTWGLPYHAAFALAEGGDWIPEPVTEVYAVLLNTLQPPFDDPRVRLAFFLAVDAEAVAGAAGDPTSRPAAGIVPYGVADYGDRPEDAAEGNTAAETEEAPTPWDFRAHSLEKVTVPEAGSYDEDCVKARELLREAGYPGGEGLPEIEYIYVSSNQGLAVGDALRDMWREKLGAEITLRAVTQEEYDAALARAVESGVETGEGGAEDAAEPEEAAGTGETGEAEAPPAAFTIAAQLLSPEWNDAGELLGLWHSGSENPTGYASDSFDILLDSAKAAVTGEARDGFLHDAEAILLSDPPVIPVLYSGESYLLSDGLTGLVRSPNGVFFLSGLRRNQEP